MFTIRYIVPVTDCNLEAVLDHLRETGEASVVDVEIVRGGVP